MTMSRPIHVATNGVFCSFSVAEYYSIVIKFFIGVQLLYNVIFLLYSKVNQLYVCIYPPPKVPSHLIQHRALSRVPCAIQ